MMLLPGSGALPILGLRAISLTPDVLTGPSVAFVGGTPSADPAGVIHLDLPVSGALIGRVRAEVVLGSNGQVCVNQIGECGAVDVA